MNHRDRFRKALRHKEPDRVPFDLDGSIVTGIAVPAYLRLVQALGLPERSTDTRYLFGNIARVHEDVLVALDVDTRPIDMTATGGWGVEVSERGANRIRYFDRWQIEYTLPAGSSGLQVASNPLASADSVQEIESFRWPAADDPSLFEGFVEQVRCVTEEMQAGVILENYIGGVFEWPAWLRGMENFMYDLAGNPAMAEAVIEKVGEWKLAFWEATLSRAGQYVDMVRESDDLGGQSGLLLSPAMYRKFFKPWHARICETIRKYTDAVICLHSCGSIRRLIPDLIEAGFGALNPIQVGAAEMDPHLLKRDFGRDLVFWGASFDSQQLPDAKPDEIKEHARRNIEALAPGGGYIFSPINMIQADVPPENIIALSEAVREFGTY